jgi:glycogen synthase
MLGWEFPPLFSGGLGIATHGIVKALAKVTSVRLIIPTAGTDPDLSGTQIIGLNTLTSNEIDLNRIQFPAHFPLEGLHTIPVQVSPYHFMNEKLGGVSKEIVESLASGKAGFDLIKSIFGESEIYGPNILYKILLYAALAEEIALKNQFDVVHAHDWVTLLAAVNIKQKTKKSLVVHVHALETDRAGQHARNEIYNLEKYGLEQADGIIAVSEYTRQQIIQHYGIAPEKIAVVHNGIAPAVTQRKEHVLRDKLVVFLGRVTHQKGPEFLLKTAEKVVQVYPRVKFVVAGTGDQFAHLLESAAYKKLGHHFIFAGFLSMSKVDELLSMADVYFMPSVSEPFGLTALEATQHQVPSVLSKQSGVVEVLKSSLKADFWDTDKYANYIHALLRYSALHHEVTLQANQELTGKTWDKSAEKIMAVYAHVQNLGNTKSGQQ